MVYFLKKERKPNDEMQSYTRFVQLTILGRAKPGRFGNKMYVSKGILWMLRQDHIEGYSEEGPMVVVEFYGLLLSFVVYAETLVTDVGLKGLITIGISSSEKGLAAGVHEAIEDLCGIEVDYVAHVKDAETGMQRAINGHSHGRENRVPVVAVTECPNNVQLLKLSIRVDDFPCLSIPYNIRDSRFLDGNKLLVKLECNAVLHRSNG
ncbi:hypothetical protein ACSQ67_025883 [Phaseolus vulgaris]